MGNLRGALQVVGGGLLSMLVSAALVLLPDYLLGSTPSATSTTAATRLADLVDRDADLGAVLQEMAADAEQGAAEELPYDPGQPGAGRGVVAPSAADSVADEVALANRWNGVDLDCADFTMRNIPITGSDPNGLDRDGDGVACES